MKDWFNKLTAVTVKNELGEEVQTLIPMLYTLKSRALIEEAIQFAPEKNVDRIRAMGMVMIYREEYRILYGENLNEGYEDSILIFFELKMRMLQNQIKKNEEHL